MITDDLIPIYERFVADVGIELGSADEHLTDERLTREQRAWIVAYLALWDATDAIAKIDSTRMVDAGFFREDFLGCWMKHGDGDVLITLAYDDGANGDRHECQITTEDGQFIAGTTGDQTITSALAFAEKALAERTAP